MGSPSKAPRPSDLFQQPDGVAKQLFGTTHPCTPPSTPPCTPPRTPPCTPPRTPPHKQQRRTYDEQPQTPPQQQKTPQQPYPSSKSENNDTPPAVIKFLSGTRHYYGWHSKHDSSWNRRFSTEDKNCALIYAENNSNINVYGIRFNKDIYLVNLNNNDVFKALYKPDLMRKFFEDEKMLTGAELEAACNCIRYISEEEAQTFAVSFDDFAKPAYCSIENGELRRYSNEKRDKHFTAWFDHQLHDLRTQFNEQRLEGFCVNLKGHHQENYYSAYSPLDIPDSHWRCASR